MELPDDGMDMSKHVEVWIMYRDTVVIYTLVIRGRVQKFPA